MFQQKIHQMDVAAIERAMSRLAPKLAKGDIIALSGDLGAGKTTVARFLITSLLGKNVDVVSPTFPILKIYQATEFLIYHYDLYRIQSPKELRNIEFYDAIDHECLVLIEWPEMVEEMIKPRALFVQMLYEAHEKRTMMLRCHRQSKWMRLLHETLCK